MTVITADLVRELLKQPEGEYLDFKRGHCPAKADEREKSKLLKDLLAFANTERTRPAYILVGISDGDRAVVGIGDDQWRDDADFHSFVQPKLNNTLRFAYTEVGVDGKCVGVFAIDPKQLRPIYCNSDYGIVREKAVYARRGSRNTQLSPHEAASMLMPPKAAPQRRGGRLDRSAKGLVQRWLRVFEVHGVERSQIPLLLPTFGLGAGQLSDERDIADLLTDDLRAATCGLFNVSRSWLEDGDRHRPQEAIFASHDMHQPLETMERLIRNGGDYPEVVLVGLKTTADETFGDAEREPCGFAIRTVVAEVGDHEVFAFYPIGGLDNWNYPKHRFYVKRLVMAAAALQCQCYGYQASAKAIHAVCEGEEFARPVCCDQHVVWYPDEYAYLSGSVVAKDCEHLAQVIARSEVEGYCQRLRDARSRLGILSPYQPGVFNPRELGIAPDDEGLKSE